jgi:hypothetical protein
VKEGTSRLPEGLLHMSEATVKLNSLVTGISRDGSFWNVHVAGADSEKFDMVIVSAPLSRANITFRGLNLWDAVDAGNRVKTVLNQGVCMDEGACMEQGVSIVLSIDPQVFRVVVTVDVLVVYGGDNPILREVAQEQVRVYQRECTY